MAVDVKDLRDRLERLPVLTSYHEHTRGLLLMALEEFEADRALARILKAEAEAHALRAALRETAIERFVVGVAQDRMRCRRCGSKWPVGDTETHEPDCLAAPGVSA